MHKTTFTIAALAIALATTPQAASAQNSRTLTGAAIGAGSGAIIAGPPGAVVGGVVGAIVGGPSVHRAPYKRCWHDRRGVRRCQWIR
jgi:hypothetical protein